MKNQGRSLACVVCGESFATATAAERHERRCAAGVSDPKLSERRGSLFAFDFSDPTEGQTFEYIEARTEGEARNAFDRLYPDATDVRVTRASALT